MRGSAIVICVACLVPGWCSADDLQGRVQDESGKPLAGVRVDVATASPKVGQGIFCPSCYLDCRKSALSDDQGRFQLKSLDAKLKFRLIATAQGRVTVATPWIDPATGEAALVLKTFPDDLPADRFLLGTVLSDEGTPIAGALVSPSGAKTSQRRWSGTVDGASPAITDDRGEFRMLLSEEFLGIDVEVEAEGYAGIAVPLLQPGESRHSIKVPIGATVRGQLVHRGHPQAFLPVAVVQVNRGGDGVFLQAIPSVTQADGRFEIKGLPAGEPYAIFSPVVEALQGLVVPTSLFDVKESGSVFELGAIELVPSLRLSGRVRRSDGAELPGELEIVLGRMPAWDLVSVKVQADGRFQIDHLPPETYEIRIASGKDWTLDESMQRQFQQLSRLSFGVRLESSLPDVEIVVRQITDVESNGLAAPRRLPSKTKGSQTLAGKVVDRDGNGVRGIRIAVMQRGVVFNFLAANTMSLSDGSFQLRNVPDEPVDLYYNDPKVRGYPVGKQGITIPYPGQARPTLNQTDVRLLFDASLTQRPRQLTEEGG